MLFSFFYNIILHLYALWGAFYLLYKKKGFKSIKGRLVPITPHFNPNEPVIWIHAVSFGEVRAAASLIERFRKEKVQLFLTTCSLTGYEEAKRYKIAHSFLPFDFPYLISPFVKKIRPSLFIMIEGDYWPNLQKSIKKYGGKILVVNGKLSERSFRRLGPYKTIVRELYGRVDHFSLQSEIYRERFASLGIESDKMRVVGNIKLESPMPVLSPEEKAKWEREYGITEGDFVLTLGSTHDPEESLWLEELSALWHRFPQLKVFLVPRHTERAAAVGALLMKQKIVFTKGSEQPSFTKGRLILVDQMGVLLRLYQLSDLAFVGGSLTERVGGHNLVEPAFYGVCALYGPYLHGQPGLAALMQEYRAGLALPVSGFAAQVAQLIEDQELRVGYGDRGQAMMRASSGAFEKSWKKIAEFLPKAI